MTIRTCGKVKTHKPTTQHKVKTFVNTFEMTCLLLSEFIFHENNQVPFCHLRCIKTINHWKYYYKKKLFFKIIHCQLVMWNALEVIPKNKKVTLGCEELYRHLWHWLIDWFIHSFLHSGIPEFVPPFLH